MLAKLDGPAAPLPASLLEEARQAVAKVDATTPAGHPRQAAINAAANLYWEAGLDTEANTLLTAELEKSRSPYYFMLDLADLAAKAGRKQEAVDLARAGLCRRTGPGDALPVGLQLPDGPARDDARGHARYRARRPVRAGRARMPRLTPSTSARACGSSNSTEACSNGVSRAKPRRCSRRCGRAPARSVASCPAKDAGRASCEKFLNACAKATHAA